MNSSSSQRTSVKSSNKSLPKKKKKKKKVLLDVVVKNRVRRSSSCEETCDAFSILLKSQQEQKTAAAIRKKKCRFVPCPAGCGVHISLSNVNFHLDECLSRHSNPQKQLDTNDRDDDDDEEEEAAPESILIAPQVPPAATTWKEDQKDEEQIKSVQSLENLDDEGSCKETTLCTAPATQNRDDDQPKMKKKKKKNALDHIMQRSRQVFTSPTTPTDVYYFCWEHNNTVTLRLSPPNSCAWQSTVRLTYKDHNHPRVIFISLCSSIPSADSGHVKNEKGLLSATDNNNHYGHHGHHRWVKHHSKLSVSVLKSMLQKSIRRRRPLPSVRIAMELADKSWPDLVRRLPIIVLEDSTLHPQFAWLVWILMATTSGSSAFQLPWELTQGIFGIIFEIASCRLKDSIPLQAKRDTEDTQNQILLEHQDEAHNKDENKDREHVLSLSSLLSAVTDKDDDDCAAMHATLCSILFRACYGGMKCDIVMLHQYAQLWNERFAASLRNDLSNHPLPSNSILGFKDNQENQADTPPRIPKVTDWRQVPAILHETARIRSAEMVPPLIQNGLDRLTMEDVCCEGVDFHCSNVMDHLLENDWMVGVASDLLVLAGDVQFVPLRSWEQRRQWLASCWKSNLWNTRSALNRRLPLRVDDNHVVTQPEPMEKTVQIKIWNELVAPQVTVYQNNYVRQRLAT